MLPRAFPTVFRYSLCIGLALAGCMLTAACSKSSESDVVGESGSTEPSASKAEPNAAAGKATASKNAGDKKLKVAFVYVGPIGDAGWTYAHDLARKDLESHFPGIETTYRESVPEGPASERALTQFAEKGYDIIFATSFGYMDPTIEVAKRYPDTVFMHCSGYKRSKNVGTYFGRMYQLKYLTGLIAGKMSKSGTVGYVAPHPIPEVIRHINAFAIGVREANPEGQVRIVWTNSWFDPGKEKQAAEALLDAGADVISTGADSAAPLQAAEERGAYAIGYDSDSRALAPKAFLTSAMWDWTVVYRDVIEKVRAGTWKANDFWGGLETGVIHLAPLADSIPAATKALVETRRAELSEGKRQVFTGPLKKQDGSVGVAAEQNSSDAELLAMKWFVEGVIGSIPE